MTVVPEAQNVARMLTEAGMPIDGGGNPIPAMRLRSEGSHKFSTSSTTARNTTAFNSDTRVVSLYATEDVYIRFGGSTVTAAATDHFFPAGVYYDFAIPKGTTHVAAIRDSADGTLYISEKY